MTAIAQIGDSRVARFCAVGLVNTVFSYGIFAILTSISGRHDLNLLISTVLGIIFAYGNSKRFVFKSQRTGRFLYYVAGYAVAFSINLITLNGFIAVGFNALAAQAISMPIVIVGSYVIHATLVFSPEPPSSRDAL